VSAEVIGKKRRYENVGNRKKVPEGANRMNEWNKGRDQCKIKLSLLKGVIKSVTRHYMEWLTSSTGR
jgi:hypothetical protein